LSIGLCTYINNFPSFSSCTFTMSVSFSDL
jgi:hypothetical protein